MMENNMSQNNQWNYAINKLSLLTVSVSFTFLYEEECHVFIHCPNNDLKY